MGRHSRTELMLNTKLTQREWQTGQQSQRIRSLWQSGKESGLVPIEAVANVLDNVVV